MITLTDSAANKVKQLLEAEGATDLALRVAVRPGGCSGFSYEMYFDGDVANDDQTLTFGEVRVIVDPASAQLLEGAVRNVGIHAAGVVIGRGPLWTHVPVGRGQAGENVAQFDKDDVEKAGLVKFDFLGLKNLTMI